MRFAASSVAAPTAVSDIAPEPAPKRRLLSEARVAWLAVSLVQMSDPPAIRAADTARATPCVLLDTLRAKNWQDRM